MSEEAPSPAQQLWTKVDQYLSAAMVPPVASIEQALADAEAAGLPPINIEANQGRFLELLVRMSGARRVLEIGTLGGYSTLWMARGLGEGGRLVTLEIEKVCADVAQANFQRAGAQEKILLRLGPALDSLQNMIAEGEAPFDFIFLDADKENYPNYLPLILQLSQAGTVLVADNVVRGGQVLDASSTEANVLGTRRFNQMLGENPRLDATALQVVGAKGHDGLALALVTS